MQSSVRADDGSPHWRERGARRAAETATPDSKQKRWLRTLSRSGKYRRRRGRRHQQRTASVAGLKVESPLVSNRFFHFSPRGGRIFLIVMTGFFPLLLVGVIGLSGAGHRA